MTKKELEAKVSIQKDIIRNANYQIYSDVNKYIKSLPFKVNDKVRCSRFDICWIVSLVPCNSNGYYNGKIQVRVNIPKKDGTRSNREYLIYSWEVDSIKKID